MFNQIARMLFLVSAMIFPVTGVAGENDLGIQFDRMPVNLKATYDEGGEHVVWVFKGRKGNLYVAERIESDSGETTKLFYDRSGHLLYREYASGNVRRFKPRHCVRVVGDCSYTYSNSQGRDGQGSAGLEKSGESYRYSWSVGGSTYRGILKFGPYNLVEYSRPHGQSPTRLIKLEAPN